jgi:ATP-dependent Lon protease
MPVLLGPTRNERKEKKVPLVPLRSGIVFPHTESFLTFGRSKSLAGVNAAFGKDRLICFVAQKNPNIIEPTLADIYRVGTLCRIERMAKINGNLHAFVKGLSRVRIESLETSTPFLMARVTEIPEITEESDEVRALCKHLTNEFKKAVSDLGKPVDFPVFMKLMGGVDSAQLADQIASSLDIPVSEKQELLEISEVKLRLEKISGKLGHEIKVLELEKKIESKTKKKLDKSMQEAILRERMKTIEEQLGEKKESREIRELRKKIKAARMLDAVRKKAEKELDQLAKMHEYNPQAAYIRTYLDWLVEMPWAVRSPNNTNIKNAQKILDEDHYGLKEVKERVLEYLAVMKLKGLVKPKKGAKKTKRGEASGPTILCFIGAPGTGKTSIGKSIARALGRKFIRVSLGGTRDEAEIRGHRRTYVGALPGRIIQGIKNAGTKNPVFMLDEIDKIGQDFRGDPSAALLEALDPEQNKEFSDHYLEVPFDLSEVMFITTGNILDTIPPALKDRLEVIRFSGYTEDEKYRIAKTFLIKKALLANGLKKDQIEIPAKALRTIIKRYTREAGVRNLEREISKVMRKIAREMAEGKKKKFKVNLKDLQDYLGPYHFSETLIEKKDEVGMATGLAWTQAGGDILFIEVVLMPGKGKIFLTGHLGQIMKESCQAAISYIRSRWKSLGIKRDFFKKLDVHVHVPEGAVPKDGPSAGCAIATAIVSALTKKPARREVGMTGEITLRGKVYEVGGIKEKVIAAHRAGLKTVVLPKENKKDMVKVPKKVKKDIKFVFADHMDQVLKVALKKAS